MLYGRLVHAGENFNRFAGQIRAVNCTKMLLAAGLRTRWGSRYKGEGRDGETGRKGFGIKRGGRGGSLAPAICYPWSWSWSCKMAIGISQCIAVFLALLSHEDYAHNDADQ